MLKIRYLLSTSKSQKLIIENTSTRAISLTSNDRCFFFFTQDAIFSYVALLLIFLLLYNTSLTRENHCPGIRCRSSNFLQNF